MEGKLGNPAPLGLMGFAMTTILLNIHNMGFYPLSSVVLSMGICYGGIAQVIAGLLSFKKGNTFAATAFTSYGFFWLSLVGIWMLPATAIENAQATPPDFLGWYLALWGLFSAFLWVGTFNNSKVQQFVFLSLTILFFLLATAIWTKNGDLHKIAGVVGVICGSSAFYLAMAELLEEVKGRRVLPY
ncbi:hypothetical protein GN157_02175 [Flavobacterium rakeshii]|uniref:Acetate uptake transporter n=1 Tax=Flavobacterium rakeshii TaxID=1038845 RepID=A0A6N8H7C3_9FLAO|nr:GPR1/FUN34/YaaH family transporter [Flavobacterium rakeshii]MUV02504.1 hypothetical protein [Flavobacterium rakeshii]